MKRAPSVLLPLIVVCVQPLAAGQTLHFSEASDQQSLKITLHPAGEPSPALRYRLLPTMPDLIPGNAAVYYGKVTAEQPMFRDRALWEKIAKWTNDYSLDELRREEVLKQLRYDTVYYFLQRAARCEYCDWQLPLGEEESYSILLPDIQQTRQFARFLAARARAEIAEGEYDEAIHTLEIGYALGRHVAEGETLVHGLVGISISGMMSRRVQELVQQPDAPNLYWALSRLPRPLVDLDRAAQAEMSAVYWSFPELRGAEDSTQGAEYWRKALLKFWQKFVKYENGDEPSNSQRAEVLTALCLKGYPMAKRALVEQGMSPDRVDAMPVGQVVAIYTMRTYDEFRDDIFKWYYVPYWEARDKIREADRRVLEMFREGREIIPLAAVLLPAVGAARTAVARCDRETALLRVLEALRMHGAAHDGHLPKTLDEVTEVPIPIDPVSGRPFDYELGGQTAVLEGPPLPGLILRLEIQFAK